MFLFAQKLKTPVSTYTDSYRPPCTMKKALYEQAPQQLWKENTFVTQGLTMSQDQNTSYRGQPEKMIRDVMQEYLYRNAVDPTAYWPEKYWLTKPEEKYTPVFVNDDKYLTWRTGPYSSAAWNKYSTYLPLPPKETRMETYLQSVPVPYPPKPACLNQYEREVVGDMLRKLSRLSPPSVQPVYTMSGKRPFQGYYSPCSGRHYCLRGMDYYVDGDPAIRRHISALAERTEHPMLHLQPHGDVLCNYTAPPALIPFYEP
ncbi:spermatid-specific manchette-related protein 1 isoform X2 [Coturnix japonica]|uniref:Sperm microtubule inner protein 6 n=1 Tax=Coturnix japonica TaxID=93934 RepID=A0A8C2Y7L4_COTJA|nr:spermatid-specific manchette-related protein 1 isoform X2 [Coturnix japonica]